MKGGLPWKYKLHNVSPLKTSIIICPWISPFKFTNNWRCNGNLLLEAVAMDDYLCKILRMCWTFPLSTSISISLHSLSLSLSLPALNIFTWLNLLQDDYIIMTLNKIISWSCIAFSILLINCQNHSFFFCFLFPVLFITIIYCFITFVSYIESNEQE